MSLETLANHVRNIKVGSEEFDTFLSSAENKESLQRYAQSLGCALTPEEQDQILSLRSAIYASAEERKAKALPDAALDGIAGGSTATAIGALVGGAIGGVAAGFVLAPVAVGFAVGAFVVGAVAGTGAIVGTAIGAIVDALS
jgi:hypothetical protein